MSRLHPLVAARKSILNHHQHIILQPSSVEEMLRPASVASTVDLRRCVSVASNNNKMASDEQKAKARDQQKKWRENLKNNPVKSAEYREMQRERTRYCATSLAICFL